MLGIDPLVSYSGLVSTTVFPLVDFIDLGLILLWGFTFLN